MAAKSPAPAAQYTAPRCCVTHAWQTQREHELLRLEAQRRNMHPDRLAADLLAAVLLNSWVDHILDRK